MRALGPSVLGALSDRAEARGSISKQQMEQLRLQLLQSQMQEHQAKLQQQQKIEAATQALRGQIPDPNMQAAQTAMQGGGGPTQANASRIVPPDAMTNIQYQAMQSGLMDPMDYMKSQQPKGTEYKVVGDALVGIGPGGVKEAYKGAAKPESMPSSIREYEYAKAQGYAGSFQQFQLEQKKAGATNVSTHVENKMGDSLAGQIGPMVKDSKTSADGAVKMFDAADRIEKALNSNKVTNGPLATQIQTVKQFAQVVGGGNDEGIRQTRQVIKALAQMSVEARKQLAGQGQVTENEAAAVAKADSGDINDLTTGELRDLATLTKRAAHYKATAHQAMIDTMSGNSATSPQVPFYKVQGLDQLLNYEPKMPQIGGPSVDDLVNKYRSK